jgi:hypothetical protein
MFKPEITSHAKHGVPAQSIDIPGKGTYDARTDTLELVTEHLAHLSVRELRSRMIRAFHAFEGKSAEHYLGGLRRAELLFVAAEYPSLYLPGMVQALGLKCDQEGRYWVPPTPEADEPASPFVADPENPTDDELAAAIDRGLANGSIITAEQFLASSKAVQEVTSPRCAECHRDAHRPGTGYQGHAYSDPRVSRSLDAVEATRALTSSGFEFGDAATLVAQAVHFGAFEGSANGLRFHVGRVTTDRGTFRLAVTLI